MLPQAMTTQVNHDEVAPPNVGSAVSRVQNFTRMNPLEFHDSKVDEDPQEFVDEIQKIVNIMEFTLVEKADLATYQCKSVTRNQWKSERAREASPVTWEEFKSLFLTISFPLS